MTEEKTPEKEPENSTDSSSEGRPSFDPEMVKESLLPTDSTLSESDAEELFKDLDLEEDCSS